MRSTYALAAGLALLAVVPADAAPGARDLVDTRCRLTPTGVTAPAGVTAPPVGNPPCPGIRPGAAYATAVGGCTLGFVFTGSDRNTYVATAGHCAVSDQQPNGVVWKPGTGPVAADPVTGKEFGRFVFARHQNGTTDFGLIRLAPGLKADPQMCHFGGPTGIATNVDFDPVALVHYGNGYGMDYARARTSYAVHGLRRPDAVTAFGLTSVGDSGSPVSTDAGLAVGVVDELVGNGNGNVLVQRLGPYLDEVRRRLGVRLTLRTAPLS